MQLFFKNVAYIYFTVIAKNTTIIIRLIDLICDNKLDQQTENDYVVESTIFEFDSEMKSVWMVKITEI